MPNRILLVAYFGASFGIVEGTSALGWAIGAKRVSCLGFWALAGSLLGLSMLMALI